MYWRETTFFFEAVFKKAIMVKSELLITLQLSNSWTCGGAKTTLAPLYLWIKRRQKEPSSITFGQRIMIGEVSLET